MTTNAPGTMGSEWLADEIARGDAHAMRVAAIRETATPEDAPPFDPSDLWLPVNEERFDYSDDGPGALFAMLVCLVLTIGAIAAAFVFI